MQLEYCNVTDFPKGTLNSLLIDGYSFDPRYQECYCGD